MRWRALPLVGETLPRRQSWLHSSCPDARMNQMNLEMEIVGARPATIATHRLPANVDRHTVTHVQTLRGIALGVALVVAGCRPGSESIAGPGAGHRSSAAAAGHNRSAAPDITPPTSERGFALPHSALAPIDAMARALATSGLSWTGATQALGSIPVRDLESVPANTQLAKSAYVLLPGYGTVKLPQGAGTDYTEVDGNEGRAQLNLYGSRADVQSISLSKFYAEHNLRDFARKLLPSFQLLAQPDPCPGAAAGPNPKPALFNAQFGYARATAEHRGASRRLC